MVVNSKDKRDGAAVPSNLNFSKNLRLDQVFLILCAETGGTVASFLLFRKKLKKPAGGAAIAVVYGV
jgi:hypothetical protein